MGFFHLQPLIQCSIRSVETIFGDVLMYVEHCVFTDILNSEKNIILHQNGALTMTTCNLYKIIRIGFSKKII